MSAAPTPDYWQRTLAQAPQWALEDELARRADEIAHVAAIRVGDLLVDPVSSLVRWRGDDYVVRGRQLEIVYALAVAWTRGVWRVRGPDLAAMVYRGFEGREAMASLRQTLGAFRRRVPDLVLSRRNSGLGYWLNVDRDAVARRVEAA